MKLPSRPNNSNIKLASQEKFEEDESWHKLVVKVIIWKEGTFSDSKLTLSEWNKYSQRIVKINFTQGKQRVLTDLKDTLEQIKLNGGLEE